MASALATILADPQNIQCQLSCAVWIKLNSPLKSLGPSSSSSSSEKSWSLLWWWLGGGVSLPPGEGRGGRTSRERRRGLGRLSGGDDEGDLLPPFWSPPKRGWWKWWGWSTPLILFMSLAERWNDWGWSMGKMRLSLYHRGSTEIGSSSPQNLNFFTGNKFQTDNNFHRVKSSLACF